MKGVQNDNFEGCHKAPTVQFFLIFFNAMRESINFNFKMRFVSFC